MLEVTLTCPRVKTHREVHFVRQNIFTLPQVAGLSSGLDGLERFQVAGALLSIHKDNGVDVGTLHSLPHHVIGNLRRADLNNIHNRVHRDSSLGRVHSQPGDLGQSVTGEFIIGEKLRSVSPCVIDEFLGERSPKAIHCRVCLSFHI